MARTKSEPTVTPPVIAKLALNAKEAADAIGVSPRKLWELTNTDQIPHARIGRLVKYPVRELQEWLAKGGRIAT